MPHTFNARCVAFLLEQKREALSLKKNGENKTGLKVAQTTITAYIKTKIICHIPYFEKQEGKVSVNVAKTNS